MYSIRQSERIRGDDGRVIPLPFPSLTEVGFSLARGRLVLIAGGPSVGKTRLALNLVLASKVPTLYFSADSGIADQVDRSISIITGCAPDHAERVMQTLHPDQIDAPIRFVYDASPSLKTIQRALQGYEEIYGEYPHIVVVDNITNVRSETSDQDPFAGLEGLCDYFNTMARETRACVVLLHHVTGEYARSEDPVPLTGIKGQIHRVPQMCATLFKRHQGIGVSVVKLRNGPFDADGWKYAELLEDGRSVRYIDPQNAQRSAS